MFEVPYMLDPEILRTNSMQSFELIDRQLNQRKYCLTLTHRDMFFHIEIFTFTLAIHDGKPLLA